MTKFELIDSGRTVNDTFLSGLKFWKTKYEHIFITDYEEEEGGGFDLKEKNLLLLICTGRVKMKKYFCIEMLQDLSCMNLMIDEFYLYTQTIN